MSSIIDTVRNILANTNIKNEINILISNTNLGERFMKSASRRRKAKLAIARFELGL